MEDTIRNQVLKDQDILMYMSFAAWDEQLFMDKIGNGINKSYASFNNEYFEENVDILKDIKTENLLYLIVSGEKIREPAKQEMIKRVRNGEHFFTGANVKFDSLGGYGVDLWIRALSAMPKEDIEFIKQSIVAQEKRIKESDPRVFDLITKAKYFTSIDNFLVYYEKGIISPEKIEFLEKLVEETPGILDSINYGIMEDSIFEIGPEFISRVAKYPNISKKILIIKENNPKLFETVKQGIIDLSSKESVPLQLELQENVLRYAARFCNDIEPDINFEELANCAIRLYDEFSMGIDVHTNSADYKADYETKCDEQYKNAKGYSQDDTNKNKRNILLKKYFGISEKEAEKFCRKFLTDINSLEGTSETTIDYVKKLQAILELNEETKIDNLYNSLQKRITPIQRMQKEYELREAYSKSYVDKLNETDESIKSSETEIIDVDGKKVKQIKLNGKFSLLVHSTDTGFKGDKEKTESFVQAWNSGDTERHLAASCYMTSEFMGHVPAKENGIVAVFTTPKKEEIGLMGPLDINSHIKSYTYTSGRSLYMTADNMPQNSRRVYSEIPVELQNPNYILIFDDTSEMVVQNSYKAAAEFDVPVLFIDKKEVVKNQLENLDGLTKRFQETGNLEVLRKLISSYETNVAGWLLNRTKDKTDGSLTNGINNERFREAFETREVVIFDMINNYIEELESKGDKSKITNVAEILQTEIDKYFLFEINKVNISQTEMKFNAQAILDRIKEKNPEIVVTSQEASSVRTIDLFKLGENISQNPSIGKTEVGTKMKALENGELEVSKNDE